MRGVILRRRYAVDSSLVLNFLLPDEQSPFSDSIFKQVESGEITLVSVSLLFYEVLNGLRSAVLRKRVSREVASGLLRRFLEIPWEVVEIDWGRCLDTASENNLTVYDAAYLTLSKRQNIKLLSLDPHLQSFAAKDA